MEKPKINLNAVYNVQYSEKYRGEKYGMMRRGVRIPFLKSQNKIMLYDFILLNVIVFFS